MKLRIRGNSIRFRLTITEVEKFATDGVIEESVTFGQGLGAFRYEMIVGSDEAACAKFEINCLSVTIPSSDARDWTGSDKVGLEYLQPISDLDSLRIVIEKDFACLAERQDEDDSDAFPNPNQTC